MPPRHAASTVASASSCGMSRYMLPSGAVPKPRREGSVILMSSLGVVAAARSGRGLRERRIVGQAFRTTAEQRVAIVRRERGAGAQALGQVGVRDERAAECDQVG